MKAYFKLTQYPKMAPPNSAYRLYQPDPVDDAVLLCDTVSIRYWTPGNDNSDCILDGQFQSGQGVDMRVSGSSGSNKWRDGRLKDDVVKGPPPPYHKAPRTNPTLHVGERPQPPSNINCCQLLELSGYDGYYLPLVFNYNKSFGI